MAVAVREKRTCCVKKTFDFQGKYTGNHTP